MSRTIKRDGGAAQIFVCDLARAAAAFAVLAAHARGFVFADLPQQRALPALGRLFFGLTAVGHQAVIVFLILSGMLVTGSVLDALNDGRWSVATYAVTRLNRLWIVLLPCLALGGLEDALGVVAFDPQALGPYGADSAQAVLGRLDLATLVGNVLFLQGFRVPVFGSNVPLWSLSIEAWCYAALLGIVALRTTWTRPLRFGCTALAAASVATIALSPAFWIIFPIWALGAGVAVLLRVRSRVDAGSLAPHTRGALHARHTGALVLVAVALAGARLLAAHHLALSDYLLAGAIAVLLVALRDWQPAGRARRLVERAAGFSYTLYLAHFPLLGLLDAVVLGHRRLPWGAAAVAIWTAALGVALLQALALWWVFERRTDALRQFWIVRLQGGTRRLSTALRTALT